MRRKTYDIILSKRVVCVELSHHKWYTYYILGWIKPLYIVSNYEWDGKGFKRYKASNLKQADLARSDV